MEEFAPDDRFRPLFSLLPNSDAGPLVELTVTQSGEPHARDMEWSEIDRSVSARPFLLETPHGASITVRGGTLVLNEWTSRKLH